MACRQIFNKDRIHAFIIPYMDLICKAIFLVFQRLFQELLPDVCPGAKLAQNCPGFGVNWHEKGLENWKKFLYNNVIELESRKSRNNISRNLQSLLKKERPFRKLFLEGLTRARPVYVIVKNGGSLRFPIQTPLRYRKTG